MGMTLLRPIGSALLAPIFAFALAGAAGAQTAAPAAPAAAPAAAGAGVGTILSDAEARTYHLGPGDRLRILVYGETDSASENNEYFVGSSGTVSVPLIGDVPAAGKTVDELRSDIVEKLKDGYLKDPKVNIEVIVYRPYYILGEVNKPGEYPYTSGLTVFSAVATAGGFTYRANTKSAYIKHVGSTTEQKEPITPNTAIQAGDTIRIGERIF
jgi:protein involved in polysaccharide export with SLBB domain